MTLRTRKSNESRVPKLFSYSRTKRILVYRSILCVVIGLFLFSIPSFSQDSLSVNTSSLLAPQTLFSRNLSAQGFSMENCCEKYLYAVAIKTNALALAATVANLGVEVDLHHKLSFDFPVYFSPYDLTGYDRIRVLLYQPELRYWFHSKKALAGHFVGLHGHLGWFNVSWKGTHRYQDNKPVMGAGISYGYALPLSGKWGLECTIGVGYARLSYNIYENVGDYRKGALIGTGSRDYWGITRAGVTFAYKFWL